MQNIQLELINITDTKQYYWFMDTEHGYFLNSISYDSIDRAVGALIGNEIKWTEKSCG